MLRGEQLRLGPRGAVDMGMHAHRGGIDYQVAAVGCPIGFAVAYHALARLTTHHEADDTHLSEGIDNRLGGTAAAKNESPAVVGLEERAQGVGKAPGMRGLPPAPIS